MRHRRGPEEDPGIASLACTEVSGAFKYLRRPPTLAQTCVFLRRTLASLHWFTQESLPYVPFRGTCAFGVKLGTLALLLWSAKVSRFQTNDEGPEGVQKSPCGGPNIASLSTQKTRCFHTASRPIGLRFPQVCWKMKKERMVQKIDVISALKLSMGYIHYGHAQGCATANG